MLQARDVLGRHRAGFDAAHANQVLLLDARVFADQGLGHSAVLRQHQQADRVDVQPPGGCQVAQVAGVEGDAAVLGPAVLRLDQHHRGFVAVFGLAADIADRFVEQDRDPLGLFSARARIDVDARFGADALAEHRQLAVDADPAGGDPIIGLAARSHPARGHVFRQPVAFAHRGARGTRWLAARRGRAAAPRVAPRRCIALRRAVAPRLRVTLRRRVTPWACIAPPRCIAARRALWRRPIDPWCGVASSRGTFTRRLARCRVARRFASRRGLTACACVRRRAALRLGPHRALGLRLRQGALLARRGHATQWATRFAARACRGRFVFFQFEGGHGQLIARTPNNSATASR